MNAGEGIIRQILDSLDDGSVFDKFARRYRHDEELVEAHMLYEKEGASDAVRERLKKLLEKRSFTGGGTRLHFKDRRRLRRQDGMEDV